MGIDFTHVSFKDFENIDGYDIFQRAHVYEGYLNYLSENEFMSYR